MRYGNEKLAEERVRVGIPVGVTNRAQAVYDALGDALAQRDIVIVSDYRSPAAVAALRHAGPQIVLQRSDWKPDTHAANQPVPAGRVWDSHFNLDTQLVITTSRRERLEKWATLTVRLEGDALFIGNGVDERVISWEGSFHAVEAIMKFALRYPAAS